MHANYALDIANSKEWTDEDWKIYALDRLVKMRAKRAPYDTMWNEGETQVNSVSFYDNDGMLQVNIPLEKTLGEIYMGRTNGKAVFDIVPDEQTDINELQPTKYAMSFYLDWVGKDNFWKENKQMRENKWKKGSGIFFTGPRNYKDLRYQVKEDAEIQSNTDLLEAKNFNEIINETWFFFPKSIHPKDFFIDDNAYGQPDVQYAEDCIYKEKITATEYNSRYGKNKAFKNAENVTYWQDINPKNKDDQAIDVRHVVLYHYFHRVTKKYLIMANETTIIYNGLYLYNDGKLPFVNVQHYSNSDRFWGESIPERIQYLKIYKSELWQDILQGAAMNNSIHLITGNEDEVGQDWTLGGRQLNIWRTTSGAESVQPVNTSINLGYFTAVLDLIDKQVVSDSGINPLAQTEASAPTLGQEELVEANRSVRNSSVDENYNIGLDDALTMMLDRIKQFAPALLSEKIKGEDGKVLKTIFPKIRIKDHIVEKKNGEMVFTESLGKYGYFDLKPGVVQGLGVRITTASTNSILPILERQKVAEFVNNMMTVANIANLDPTGGQMKILFESMKTPELLKWMSDAYGYDINSLKSNTEKDKISEENLKKLADLTNLLSVNPHTNEGNPTESMAQPNQDPSAGVNMPGSGQPDQAEQWGVLAGAAVTGGNGSQVGTSTEVGKWLGTS